MVMLWRMARRRRKEGWEDVFLFFREVFRVIHPAWSIPLAIVVFAIPVAFFQLKVNLPGLQNLGFLIGGAAAAVIDGAQLATMLKRFQPSPDALGGTSKHGTGDAGRTAVPARPTCPRCGGEMVLRRSRKGQNAGKEFWGCSGFPRCRGIVEVG